MRVKTRKTEDEVRKTFFGPVNKAARTSRPWTEVAPTWCELSETRFFCKLIEYKPAGINKNFNLGIITDHMNNIYEDEAECEEYVLPEDLITIRNRKENNIEGDIMKFPPKYRIRPTLDQIVQKLDEMYNMTTVDEHEGIPEEFEKETDFFLPDGEFGELIQQKQDLEKPNELMQPPADVRSNTRPPGPPRAKKRRRGSTDSSSRASTPQWPHRRQDLVRDHDF